MPTRNSTIVSSRLMDYEAETLKRMEITATQILRKYLNGELRESGVDTSAFESMCRRTGRKPQEILDRVTEQMNL